MTSENATIVIVTFNSRDDIGRCLESLSATGSGLRNVVVVDNVSGDDTVQIVRRAFPDVRVVVADRNLGFGGGCNLGARENGGDVLVFLNPDTMVEPGWLEPLVAAFARDPAVGFATARLLMPDRSKISACGMDIHISGVTLNRGQHAPLTAFLESAEPSAAHGAAFAIRRDVFTALHGFDERMFLYMEDADLSWRARLAGWRGRYVPESVVRHNYRLRFQRGKIFFQERNRYLMLAKSLRWPTLIFLAPALVLAEIMTWGFVVLRRLPPGEKLAAYGWMIREWRTVRDARRVTQATRRATDRALLESMVGTLAFNQVGDGASHRVAAFFFDPLFSLWRGIMLGLVRW